MLTEYHAKYFAYDLTKSGGKGVDRLGQSLFNASVDLNPHQVEAALFALRSPLSKGVLLADEVEFDLSGYPAKISVLEALKSKSGWLLLNQLAVNSLDKEEFLLFFGFTDDGKNIPEDVLCQLFKLAGTNGMVKTLSEKEAAILKSNMELLSSSTLQKSMEENNLLFKERQEQLNRWVDDQVAMAERALTQVKQELRSARHELDIAANLDEQAAATERVDALERKKRRARSRIDDVEEEAESKRKAILGELRRKLVQNVTNTPLFTIHWKIQ